MGEERHGPRFGPLALAIKLGPKLASVLFKSKVFWAAASLAAYSTVFSWKFALILMGSVFFHELGHVRAMKVFGIQVKGIYFLPFMGGAAVGTGRVTHRKADAYIALWGPLWGFALALATLDVYFVTGSEYVATVAAWMAAINLFNLLPVWPLDGGRFITSIARSVGTRAGLAALVGGYLALGVGAIVLKLSLFVFLLIAGGFELWGELQASRREKERRVLVFMLATAFRTKNDAESVAAEIERRFARAASCDSDAVPSGPSDFLEHVRVEPPSHSKAFALSMVLRDFLVFAICRSVRSDWSTALITLAMADRSEFYAVLAGPKQPDPMSPLQSVAAMAGYAALIVALAGVLYASQVNPVTAAALGLFID